jgi:hypothetical protein
MSVDAVKGFLEGPGDYFIQVVGESSYQDALEGVCGGRTEDGADEFVEAVLILEDTNPNDHNAVRVDINGCTVGYLTRDFAVQYRRRLIEAGYPSLIGTCRAHIRGVGIGAAITGGILECGSTCLTKAEPPNKRMQLTGASG